MFTTLDWIIVVLFFIAVLTIGFVASRKARENISEYFLGGRKMPWWLLGISMVACTFSADTPNLVTDMVRSDGVAKNWAWWAFLITGMVTVFIYSKLWRRSNITTDLEFYEIRYGGKPASFLRGFRALYLGVFFNVLIMASVTLAAIKIGAVMFHLPPWVTVVVASVVVVIYTAIGGLRSVVWADFFQYSIATAGAILAAVVAVKHQGIGSLSNLLAHPSVSGKINLFPDFSNVSILLSLFIIPIAVQWWSVWYPGAEPGGGGYIAQRMLSAKNEKHAVGATLFFNFMHYAIRPWPWIIVALASIVIYPDLESIRKLFPNLPETYLKNDIAYPIMLLNMGKGWLGLVVASLIGAYMSTIGTHLNWGASYVVNDFYLRFVKPEASQNELIRIGQLTTVILMVLSGIIALTIMENAQQAFDILLLTGAGSGAIYLLRWFWWRINAWSEISAMIAATVNAFILVFLFDNSWLQNSLTDPSTAKLLIAIVMTSAVWILVTFATNPEKPEVLERFCRTVGVSGGGWKKITSTMNNFSPEKQSLAIKILFVFIGCLTIYSLLFAIGSMIYGQIPQASLLFFVGTVGIVAIFKGMTDKRSLL